MKKQLFTLANTLRGTGLTRTDAFKKAWATLRIKQAMTQKPVAFAYWKNDGSERKAVGFYGEHHQPNPEGKKGPVHVIKYFDLTCNGWRSFRADRLIIA